MLYIYIDYAEVSPLSGYLMLKGNGGICSSCPGEVFVTCLKTKPKPKPTHLQPS